MRAVYIGVGGNEGDRLLNLLRGILLIGKMYPILAVSSVYLTEAWGFKSRPFLNALLLIVGPDNPFALLRYLKDVERSLGRRINTAEYSPRPFDADILIYEGLRLRSPNLTIPHPRMQERAFVMVPLREMWEVGYPRLGTMDEERDTGYVRKVIDRNALFKLLLS